MAPQILLNFTLFIIFIIVLGITFWAIVKLVFILFDILNLIDSGLSERKANKQNNIHNK